MFVIMNEKTEEIIARFETEQEAESAFADIASEMWKTLPDKYTWEIEEKFRYDWKAFCEYHDYEISDWLWIYREA